MSGPQCGSRLGPRGRPTRGQASDVGAEEQGQEGQEGEATTGCATAGYLLTMDDRQHQQVLPTEGVLQTETCGCGCTVGGLVDCTHINPS
jgi:hypothetical protein